MTLKQFRARLDLAFWCGFFAHAFLNCLIQDAYGLEGYKAMLDKRWLDIPWWMWVPLLLLVFFIDLENKQLKPVFFSKRKEESKKFEHDGIVYEGHSRDKS